MDEQGNAYYIYHGGVPGNGEGDYRKKGVRTVEVDKSVTFIMD